jgi:ribosome-associated protein
MPDDLVVTRSVRIPRHELHVSFSPSGGPGGQHANRAATRVELRFDVAGSSAFTPGQRDHLIGRLGTEVRVVADESRSQLRNREQAERRLVGKLQAALRVERSRRPTKPSKAAKGRRLDDKRRRSETKRRRRRPRLDD